MTLYHFTCDHGAAEIDASGIIIPNRHPVLGVALLWATPLRSASREALGLTSKILDCDRMAHVFEITEPDDVHPWSHWRNALPYPRIALIEATRGVRPSLWYAAAAPVAAVRAAA